MRLREALRPLLSSFYGVLIYQYWLDTRQHHLPHIPAMYAGEEAVFAIESGEPLDGNLPRRQTRLESLAPRLATALADVRRDGTWQRLYDQIIKPLEPAR